MREYIISGAKRLIKEILPQQITDLLEEYTEYIRNIINKFRTAIKLLNEMRIGEARTRFAEIVKIQKEADNTRKRIITLLEEVRLDPGFKHDFFHLVRRLDRITDWIKEAARELTIIPYLEIPEDIRRGVEKLIDEIVEATEDIVDAVEKTVEGDYEEARKLIERVEEIEERADEIDVENRGKLLKYHDQFKPYTLAILVHDLNHDLEEAADACQEAGDYLRALIVGWARK